MSFIASVSGNPQLANMGDLSNLQQLGQANLGATDGNDPFNLRSPGVLNEIRNMPYGEQMAQIAEQPFSETLRDASSSVYADRVREAFRETMEGAQGAATSVPAMRRLDAPSFGDMVENLVRDVDRRQDIAAAESRAILTGESDNLHQAMIARQEAGIAFDLMVEVRNKLVESYKELMRVGG